MYIHMGVHMYLEVQDQLQVPLIHYCTPVFLMFLTEPEVRWFSYSGWSLCFRVLLSPLALGYSCVTSCPACSMGSGDLNSGPHSCGYQPTG